MHETNFINICVLLAHDPDCLKALLNREIDIISSCINQRHRLFIMHCTYCSYTCIVQQTIVHLVIYSLKQCDHKWSMTNQEFLANIHLYACYRRNFMIFSNIISPDETPCNTASHFDPCCLKMAKETLSKIRKNPEMIGLLKYCTHTYTLTCACTHHTHTLK